MGMGHNGDVVSFLGTAHINKKGRVTSAQRRLLALVPRAFAPFETGNELLANFASSFQNGLASLPTRDRAGPTGLLYYDQAKRSVSAFGFMSLRTPTFFRQAYSQ